MFLRILILVSISLLMFSCATTRPETAWYKSGASDHDFHMDQGFCRAQAMQATMGYVTMGTAVMMGSCLQSKGWYLMEVPAAQSSTQSSGQLVPSGGLSDQ